MSPHKIWKDMSDIIFSLKKLIFFLYFLYSKLIQKKYILPDWLTKTYSFGLHLPDFTCNPLFLFYLRAFKFYIVCILLSLKYILTITLLQIHIINCVIYITYYHLLFTWYLSPFIEYFLHITLYLFTFLFIHSL